MKGRQLTLKEVLRLDDGSRVWVEDNDEDTFFNSNQTLIKQKHHLIDEFCYLYEFNICKEYVTFYEWTDDEDTVGIKSNAQIRCSTCYKLAQEICNLRGIDLTEDNIDKIMKEFVDKE